MHDVVYPIAAAIGWVAFLYKLVDLRRDPRNPTLRALCIALLFPALAFTIATPALFAPIDRLIGFPNLAKLWVHGSLVVFSATVQRLLLCWAFPAEQARPRVRRRVFASAAALAAMTVLLILAPVNKPTSEFTQTYATTPYVAEYLLVYLTAVGAGLAEIARLCWRYASVAGRPWLVRGLHITATGAAIGMGYCVSKALYVVGRNLGVDLAGVNESSAPFAALGAILVFIGLTIPAWGERLTAAAEAVGRYRAYWGLYPLWRALYEAAPGIALDPPARPGLDRVSVRDLRHRLYRRVIEIRDGRLALRGYLDPAVAETARAVGRQARLAGEHLAATAEAALLAAALRARAAGREPGETDLELVEVAGGGQEMVDETRWLLQVSRAFAHSPVVRTTLDHTATDGDTAGTKTSR